MAGGETPIGPDDLMDIQITSEIDNLLEKRYKIIVELYGTLNEQHSFDVLIDGVVKTEYTSQIKTPNGFFYYTFDSYGTHTIQLREKETNNWEDLVFDVLVQSPHDFNDITEMKIGNKTVEGIYFDDDSVFYEIPMLKLSSNKNYYAEGETATITVKCTNNGIGVVGETVSYSENYIVTNSQTTNNNGECTFTTEIGSEDKTVSFSWRGITKDITLPLLLTPILTVSNSASRPTPNSSDTFTGTLTDSNGNGIGGETITITYVNNIKGEGVTNSDGSYSIPIEYGSSVLKNVAFYARFNGNDTYKNINTEIDISVKIKPVITLSISESNSSGITWSGTLKSSSSNNGISNNKITLYNDYDTKRGTATTGSDGGYRFSKIYTPSSSRFRATSTETDTYWSASEHKAYTGWMN